MKADRCGAWAEQCRYRQGWITGSERKQRVQEGKLRPGHLDGEKCMCCKHLESTRCSKGNFATRVNCYCNEFESKKKELTV